MKKLSVSVFSVNDLEEEEWFIEYYLEKLIQKIVRFVIQWVEVLSTKMFALLRQDGKFGSLARIICVTNFNQRFHEKNSKLTDETI